ncbi:MAG TPA: hypothetical protein VFQ61_10490, partial [Polyangiaceae bacterium]|nr:hypothetical protein [Polyangiaceae bacterium]
MKDREHRRHGRARPEFARYGAGAAIVLAGMSVCGVAHAAGYDTPMLYSARHLGMGGSAIGYVDDPSALFHNPAGLAAVRHAGVLGDFSLLLGHVHGSPNVLAQNRTSELTVAPFFLVGGAFRVHRLLTVGLGIYPIASSGATYEYGQPGFEDTTKLLFVEGSLAVGVNLAPRLRLGLGYRVTFVELERFSGNRDDGTTPFLDFRLRGHNFGGFRVGLQFDATPDWKVGVSYRHQVTTRVENELGVALRAPYEDVHTEFLLPSKLGLGTRYDLDGTGVPVSAALDLEYTFGSQNVGTPLIGVPRGGTDSIAVPNVFEWDDSLTARVGLEYRVGQYLTRGARVATDAANLPDAGWAFRLGYVLDTRATN